jgi:hypothetical protein
MAKPTIFTQIPQPTEDLKSLLQTVLALKENIETLLGEKGDSGWANQTFIEATTPTARLKGDMWYKPSTKPNEPAVLSIWTGSAWVVV